MIWILFVWVVDSEGFAKQYSEHPTMTECAETLEGITDDLRARYPFVSLSCKPKETAE